MQKRCTWILTRLFGYVGRTRANICSKYVEIFGARTKKHDKCTFEDHAGEYTKLIFIRYKINVYGENVAHEVWSDVLSRLHNKEYLFDVTDKDHDKSIFEDYVG